MSRAVLLAFVSVLVIAAPAVAQQGPTGNCGSLPRPTLGAAPDEPPSLRAPAAATIARRPQIEALPLTDAARPDGLFDLAEAYRSLGARDREAQVLAVLIQDHPHWAHMDRANYRLARSLEAQQQRDQARLVWMHLLRDHPTSDYVPAAYMSFGDYFFAQGDYPGAQQLFERAAAFPRSRWLAYVEYRLAWTLASAGDRTAPMRLADATRILADASQPQLDAAAVRAAVTADRASIARTLACAGAGP